MSQRARVLSSAKPNPFLSQEAAAEPGQQGHEQTLPSRECACHRYNYRSSSVRKIKKMKKNIKKKHHAAARKETCALVQKELGLGMRVTQASGTPLVCIC